MSTKEGLITAEQLSTLASGRRVELVRPDGSAHIYSGEQDVPGEDVVPGFSFRVSRLFEE